MRIASHGDIHAASRPGGSAATSVAVLVLILAPALVAITGAEARSSRAVDQPAARPGALAGGQPIHAPASGQPVRFVAAAPGAAGGMPAARAVSAPDQAADAGVQLLEESASAGRALFYEGVQIISWWGLHGASTAVVNVTHQPGQGTLLRTMRTGSAPGASVVANEPGAPPGDVLGITEETLDLLAANYQVAAAGDGSACGRRAQIVEARRADGTLAARFWLDTATKIALRRELFDQQAGMINEDTFIDVEFTPPVSARPGQAGPMAAIEPRPWDPLATADLNGLRAANWPLPAQLPGELALFDARRDVTPSGQVIELSYSDGLSSVSLFVQRGALPRKLAGWRPIVLGGWPVLARDSLGQRLTWSSRGHVLTLIAEAPPATISVAVQALPHDTPRGFWARMGHGLSRVVSWVDPFD